MLLTTDPCGSQSVKASCGTRAAPERFLVAVGICTYTVCDSAMNSHGSCRAAGRAAATGVTSGDAGRPEPPAVAAGADTCTGVSAAATVAGAEGAAAEAAGFRRGGGTPGAAAGDAAAGRKVSSAAARRGRGCGDAGGAVCAFNPAHAGCAFEPKYKVIDTELGRLLLMSMSPLREWVDMRLGGNNQFLSAQHVSGLHSRSVPAGMRSRRAGETSGMPAARWQTSSHRVAEDAAASGSATLRFSIWSSAGMSSARCSLHLISALFHSVV
jgi:hypothetical protein